MSTETPDIFSSDQIFIRVASGILIGLGLGSLLVILVLRLVGAEALEIDWVTIFGGFEIFRRDLAAINLPLAMLILGIGLRLHTPFGWFTCLILLFGLLAGFSLLAWRLSRELESYWTMVAQDPNLAASHPLLESIAVNIGLAILAFSFLIYLFLPSVRKIFWSRPRTD